MATTEVTERIIALPMRSTDDRRFDGVHASDDDYGLVQLVRRTTTTRYSAEATGRRSGRSVLDQDSIDETLAENLDGDAVLALIQSLNRALVLSLTVTEGLRR